MSILKVNLKHVGKGIDQNSTLIAQEYTVQHYFSIIVPPHTHTHLFLCPHLNMAKEQHRLEEEILKDPRRGFKNITLELTEHSRGENGT